MPLSKALKRNKGWLAAGALIVVAGATYLVLNGSDAPADTTTYQTEAVSVGTLSVTVAGTGDLEMDGTTDVYPDVAGTVASVEVSEGSLVETGTVLFTLNASSAKAETARSLASLRQAEQGIAQAQLQVTKSRGALASLEARASEPTPTVTSADIDAAKAEVAVAKAQLASAQAQRTSAAATYEDALAAEDDLAVTAPCSGVVYSLDIAAGNSVSSGDSGSSESTAMTASAASATSGAGNTSTAPVVIAPEQPLSVHLTINEVDVPSLELGQRADIEFDAFPDLTATGKVYEIAETGSNSSGVVTFDVWLSIDVADARLRSGMSAAATIVTDLARDALTVSNSAVQSDDSGGYYVQVLDSGDNKKPRKVAVETGLASSTQTQILSGLAEGDLVVTQTLDTADDQASSGAPGSGGLMMPGMGGGPRD